jgi:hypothetical protein
MPFSFTLGVCPSARASDQRERLAPERRARLLCSACPSPATQPADRRVISGSGRRGPQSGEVTPTRDQHQRSGQTEQERVQGRHHVDLLKPRVEDMQLQETYTVIDWPMRCVPLVPSTLFLFRARGTKALSSGPSPPFPAERVRRVIRVMRSSSRTAYTLYLCDG